MKYKIASYTFFNVHGELLIFGMGSRQKIIADSQFFSCLAKFAHTAIEYTDKNQHKKKLESDLDQDAFNNCYDFFKDNCFLTFEEENDIHPRYDRQLKYYNYLCGKSTQEHKRIENSKITIIGAGGMGNHISYMLASAGVGSITVIDGDIIEESNLTRQFLFNENDIGKYKVEVLKKKIGEINKKIKIDVIKSYWSEEKDIIPKSDFIVLCADYPRDILLKVNAYCIQQKTPFINCGYYCDIAIFGPLVIPGETGCIECGNKIFNTSCEDTEIKESFFNMKSDIDKKFQTPSIAPINNIASGYAALDIIKYLSGAGEPLSKNRQVGIHTQSLKIQINDNKLKSNCKQCSHLQPIKSAP